ncbi:hypothetical protein M8J76_016592 [Diaphorina citri]|nr:hypothetical protein M8J76_016592 [Diaphorina citri]
MSSLSWWQILTTLMMLNLAGALDVGFTTCATDVECGPHEFCYESGLCVPCLDCAIYRRHNSSWTDCAKDAKQCGTCFNGYKEDIFTNGDRRDSCITARNPFRQNLTAVAEPTIRFAQLGQLLIIAVTTSVFVLGFLWCRTNLSKSSHRPADIPCRGQTGFWDYYETQLTRQTSQTSCASSLDQAEAGAVHTTIFNAQVLKDSQQQAIPFLRPNYERQENVEIDEEEEEVHAPQSPDMSFLHDQDTMPSTWSPEANESTSSNDTIHNFDQPGTSSGNENSNDSEPQPKRIRLNNSESDDKIDVCNPMSNQDESQTGEEHVINLYITNNVLIRKS